MVNFWACTIYAAHIYLFKVNNGNTRTMCVICSKLKIKTQKWHLVVLVPSLLTHSSGVSIVDFALLNTDWVIASWGKTFVLVISSEGLDEHFDSNPDESSETFMGENSPSQKFTPALLDLKANSFVMSNCGGVLEKRKKVIWKQFCNWLAKITDTWIIREICSNNFNANFWQIFLLILCHHSFVLLLCHLVSSPFGVLCNSYDSNFKVT